MSNLLEAPGPHFNLVNEVDEEEGYRKIRRIPLGGLSPIGLFKTGE